jgi:hypothetical protein
MRLIDRFVDWWLRRCVHDGSHVAADILEGDGGIQVKYCRRCGAVRRGGSPEWRRPRPLWYPVGKPWRARR